MVSAAKDIGSGDAWVGGWGLARVDMGCGVPGFGRVDMGCGVRGLRRVEGGTWKVERTHES